MRFIQSIIAKNKLSSKPFTPINKPGGSGAEALVHVKNAKDPDHTLMFTLNSFYTTPLLQPGLGIDINEELIRKHPLVQPSGNDNWTTVRKVDGSLVKP